MAPARRSGTRLRTDFHAQKAILEMFLGAAGVGSEVTDRVVLGTAIVEPIVRSGGCSPAVGVGSLALSALAMFGPNAALGLGALAGLGVLGWIAMVAGEEAVHEYGHDLRRVAAGRRGTASFGPRFGATWASSDRSDSRRPCPARPPAGTLRRARRRRRPSH